MIRLLSASRRCASRFVAEKTAGVVPRLSHPIGVVEKPSVLDNQSKDNRTRAQKKKDLLDQNKILARRKELLEEITKPSFTDIYAFRDTLGKTWRSPAACFKASKALYMPNLWGHTLAKTRTGTTGVLEGATSIVRVFTALTGEQQTATYFDKDPCLLTSTDLYGAQLVDINLPENWAKEWLVRLTAPSIARRLADPSRQHRYFICRKGVTKQLKQSILLDNLYTGYIYLVDRECRIRWFACGYAHDDEKALLPKLVRYLVKAG